MSAPARNPATTVKPVCVIAGAGPGNGQALARAFAGAGHAVALLARRAESNTRLAAELGDARAHACDLADAQAMAQVFARIGAEMGPVQTLIYNAGAVAWGAIDEVSSADFEQMWRCHALGLFLAAQQVVPAMKARGEGCIVVIGATASRRGVARTAALAPAKMAQRGLAESMARQLGPHGVHVALIVVDGIVDSAEARTRLADRPADAFIDPRAVAATALQLTRQDRSAWSFEVDLRPFNEKW